MHMYIELMDQNLWMPLTELHTYKQMPDKNEGMEALFDIAEGYIKNSRSIAVSHQAQRYLDMTPMLCAEESVYEELCSAYSKNLERIFKEMKSPPKKRRRPASRKPKEN